MHIRLVWTMGWIVMAVTEESSAEGRESGGERWTYSSGACEE